LASHPTGDVVCIGDKSKAQLQRLFPKNIVASFSGLGSRLPTFAEASLIANQILSIKPYESISVVYNQ